MNQATSSWIPRAFPFLRWGRRVDRESLRGDAVAGLTGALVVLPQGVAFATIAGLPPEYGLYSAILPAVVAALFGSSWHLVSGPTTAISIVVFAAVSPLAEPGTETYVRLALTLTFMVGMLQLALGVARVGTLVNFISHTVVVGFTAGAGLLIASSQLKAFFGVDMPRGASFYHNVRAFIAHAGDIDPWVTSVAAATLLTAVLARRWLPRLPYMIVAMLVGSIAGAVLNAVVGQDTTHLRTVGALPRALPPLSAPRFDFDVMHQLWGNALAVTMLALTEAVSIARAVAVRSEQRIDGNQEFIGQGLSNVVGSFFSSYASSGSFNRTGLNYEAGARTPLAVVFASAFLAVTILLVAPLAAYLPTAAMAGILFVVAWSLVDVRHIRSIVRASRSETVILAATFLATLLVDLEVAIYVGVTASFVFYLGRTSRPLVRAVVPHPRDPKRRFLASQGLPECSQLKIVEVRGSLFFGAVDHVQHRLQQIEEENPRQKHILIIADCINFADLAGAEMLAREARRRRRAGGGLYLLGVKERTGEVLRSGGYLLEIGPENVFTSKAAAIEQIDKKLDKSVCQLCGRRIFKECPTAPAEELRREAGARG